MWNPYKPLEKTQRRVLAIAGVLFVLVLWALISGMGWVSPVKLPTPFKVASAFLRLAWDSDRGESLLFSATLSSLRRVALASILVMLIGIPIGIVMGASPKINALLSPLVDPFRSAPVVALLPIMVMWFGIEELMKVAFLFLGAVVYLVPMVRDAIRAVPRRYFMSARDLGATPFEAVRLSLIPMALPRIADAAIASVSIMWTYITVAEYVNAKEGLGQLIQNARRFSAMDQVFVGIFVIIALALISYQAMTFAKKKLFAWESQI